ncbi:DNA binding domain-containing protein, excisionase family [Rhodopirellula sallentina SM41]|uniref:DNA binding domain-containing protein, excisionase family n=1 Tax=Rhodopirellula sallentina SM41 TaxID=1263870 RepID=M5TU43_9BACT|nr:DNA binding domain-containing protein, excisionase family [Rhodopirellula sallentina SM41]
MRPSSTLAEIPKLAAEQPLFSPKQVACALSVSESSVKRWCDCGAICSQKTAGGHRKISLEALQRFLATSQRSLCKPETLGLPKMLPTRHVCLEGKKSPRNQCFRDALARGEFETCRGLLYEMVDEGASRSQAAECLIADAMHGVGKAWQCEEIDVYQERRACDVALRLIFDLNSSLPPVAEDAPVAIGGSPMCDPYQLPTALVELTLREVGWKATSLGNQLPLESFIQATVDCRPHLVWLSVSSIDDEDTFVARQNRMAESLADDVVLLVGGRALTDSLRPRLRFTAHCDSLRQLGEMAEILRLKFEYQNAQACAEASSNHG